MYKNGPAFDLIFPLEGCILNILISRAMVGHLLSVSKGMDNNHREKSRSVDTQVKMAMYVNGEALDCIVSSCNVD